MSRSRLLCLSDALGGSSPSLTSAVGPSICLHMTAMRTKWKRRVFLAIICFALMLIGLVVFTSSGRMDRHRAWSLVTITPSSNAVLSADFQKRTLQSFRHVRVEEAGSFRTSTPSGGVPKITPAFRLIADSPDSEEAARARDEATEALREAVLQSYGATLEVIDRGENPLRPFPRVFEALDRVLEPVLKRVGII
jgi:hypothetical protein